MSPVGSGTDPGLPEHFRGWSRVWVGVGPAPSREAPLAAASGACGGFGLQGRPVSPRGGGGEEAESPLRHKGPFGGGGAGSAGGAAPPSPGAEGRVRRRWATRRWPRRFQLLGDAEAVRGWERGGGGVLAWGAGRDKDRGSLLLTGHTPECWSRAEVEGMWETQRTSGRGAKWCLVAVVFLGFFVPDSFAPQLSWIAPGFSPSHHPHTATLTLLWFPSLLPPLFTHSFFG